MVTRPCPTCGGKRLKPEVLAVTVDGRTIWDVSVMSITDALAWVAALPKQLSDRERTIAYQVLKEITARLGFLVDVGLDYLALDRTSRSRCPAARPSGSGSRPRSGRRSWASSTSSTSRRSGSTSATTRSSSRR